jgi:hypothetical protein
VVVELRERELGYLRSLVRVSVRKQRRAVVGFRAFPGQDPDEAVEALARIQASLEFRECVYVLLGGDLDAMAEFRKKGVD